VKLLKTREKGESLPLTRGGESLPWLGRRPFPNSRSFRQEEARKNDSKLEKRSSFTRGGSKLGHRGEKGLYFDVKRGVSLVGREERSSNH